MSEPADRQDAGAGIDERAYVVEIDAARDLQAFRVADRGDRPAHAVGRRVVEQDPLGPERERLVELLERLDLHLDR